MKSIHIAVLILILTVMSALYVPSQAKSQRKNDSTAEILKFEDGFSAALAHNDIAALKQYLSDDWSIVSGDGQIISRERYLTVLPDEIGTAVIVKIHGRWVCVLTQLTTVAEK